MKDHILDLDKPRELRYGFKAIRKIRQKFGNKKLEDLMKMNVDEAPVLAWAGLTHDDPKLTVEKVEQLLDNQIPKRYKLIQILEIVMGAISDQMGVPVPTEEEKKKNEKNSEAGKEERKQPAKKIPSKKSVKKQ